MRIAMVFVGETTLEASNISILEKAGMNYPEAEPSRYQAEKTYF
jgi:hypothetical protein